MKKKGLWRTILGGVIQRPAERQRIASELGISPVTLTRWASGESNPRTHSLRLLLTVLNTYQQQMLPSIREEFPSFNYGFSDVEQQQDESGIPSDLYDEVIHAACTTSKSQRFSVLSDLILRDLQRRLDPNNSGLFVGVIQCMPPSQGEILVRSLRLIQGYVTKEWKSDTLPMVVFLGGESLTGQAVTSGRLRTVQNLEGIFSEFHNYHSGFGIGSLIAVPIFSVSCIAGCLSLVSPQKDFFLPARQALIQNYAELLALAFEQKDFYPINSISLGIMPPIQQQRSLVATFRDRLIECRRHATAKGISISSADIELLTWQKIEHDLLQLSYSVNMK